MADHLKSRFLAPFPIIQLASNFLGVLEEHVERARELMAKASRDVLGGFELGTDVEIIRYPERYCDEDRGREFWEMVMDELDKLKTTEANGDCRIATNL